MEKIMLGEVTILRGIPGSGKSTLAKELQAVRGGVIISADHYFEGSSGDYNFNASELPQAHQDCWRKFYNSVFVCFEKHIIVDNTNITASEIAPYVLPAEAYGYRVQIHTLKVNREKAARRNIHGVPFDVVFKMSDRLNSEVLPPWWNHTIETRDGL